MKNPSEPRGSFLAYNKEEKGSGGEEGGEEKGREKKGEGEEEKLKEGDGERK